ncbi:MAG: hypothetical protein QXO48_04105 [Desulfurococcaceae archaeon]|jgi:hypothetical protein
MITLGVNILASYLLWVAVTLVFKNRVKKMLIYALFPFALYSAPCVYYALAEHSMVYALPVVLSALVLVYHAGKDKKKAFTSTIIPLPQVLTLVYIALVHSP